MVNFNKELQNFFKKLHNSHIYKHKASIITILTAQGLLSHPKTGNESTVIELIFHAFSQNM